MNVAAAGAARRSPALLMAVLLAMVTATPLGAAVPATAPLSGPLVQFIDTVERDDHADLSVQFSCTVHYVGNTPLDHGSSTTITLRLGPDCGNLLNRVPPELPLVGGGGQLVTGARVDSQLPGQATLTFDWVRAFDFVLAPSASGLELRVRLIGTAARRSHIAVAADEAPKGYAVNLESSLQRFDRAAVEAAASRLRTQAYVSETDIEEDHWYRLRVGPFSTEAEAERVLQVAQAQYPRAWLAEDEDGADLAIIERAGVASAVAGTPTDPPLESALRAQLLRDARAAMEAHRYPEAVDLLTRLLRQPEYPERADAQELLGLVRERAGQLAQAKAECDEYLRRYGDRPAALRVRARLQALTAAALTPRSVGAGTTPDSGHWTMVGSASVTYQYGLDQSVAQGVTTSTTSANSALAYGDLLLRDRGTRYDFTARVDAGYTQNLVTTFGGSQDRTTIAYLELTDRTLGWTARVGRQSLAAQGNIGLFDGLTLGYQVDRHLEVTVAAGLPAYSGYSNFSTQQTFETLSAEWDPNLTWSLEAYLFNESVLGNTDRRAVGLQTRYAQSGRTAVVLVDYDVQFQQLNSVTLIGNTRIGSSWILGLDLDHRRSPLLELNDALIGQSATDLNALANEFTPSQIEQLARDRTATSDTLVVSASRALGERWQFMTSISALQLSSTTGSGGVAATPSTGLDKNISVQFSGLSLLQASDLHIFGVRFDDSPLSRSETISWDARFVVRGAWRLGPRLSVEQSTDQALGSKRTLYLPEVRSDWTGRRSVVEFSAGYQVQQQQALQSVPGSAASSAQQRSLYASASYRLRF